MKTKTAGKRNRFGSSFFCLLVAAGCVAAPLSASSAGCRLSFRQGFLGVVNRHNPCYSTAVADFNGDGHADLAVLLASSGQVLIYNGDGNGGFGAPATYAGGNFPEWVAAGDFNGDGKPDLVVANFGGSGLGGISTLLNNGSGGFGAPALVPLGSFGITQVVVADFNRDGKLDIAAADSADGNTIVLLGNGGGGFGAPMTLTGTGGGAMAVGDFNGDGIPDLAETAATQLNILLGNGAGGFTTVNSYPFGPGNPTSVVAADFNHDGRLDLAVATVNNTPQVATFLGDGTGNFAASAPGHLTMPGAWWRRTWMATGTLTWRSHHRKTTSRSPGGTVTAASVRSCFFLWSSRRGPTRSALAQATLMATAWLTSSPPITARAAPRC